MICDVGQLNPLDSRLICVSSLDTFDKCRSTKMTEFQQKKMYLDTFISWSAPGVCYVPDIVIFCHNVIE